MLMSGSQLVAFEPGTLQHADDRLDIKIFQRVVSNCPKMKTRKRCCLFRRLYWPDIDGKSGCGTSKKLASVHVVLLKPVHLTRTRSQSVSCRLPPGPGLHSAQQWPRLSRQQPVCD